MSHLRRLRYQRVLPHEPACIIEKRIEWDRSNLLRSELAFIHIRLERRSFARIKVPVWPRPQEHAGTPKPQAARLLGRAEYGMPQAAASMRWSGVSNAQWD